MIVALVLGLVIGVALGGFGGGGSILAVPVLAHVLGLSAAAATATSLVAVGAASLVGAVGHWRLGRVRWGTALLFAVTGIPGSWAGAALNDRMDGDLLLLLFSVLVLVAARRMLTACPSCTKVGEEEALTAELAGPAGSEAAAGAVAGQAVLVRRPAPALTLRSSWDRLRQGGNLGTIALAGTGVGFLTGLFGVGGGFVIVPALTLILGLSMPVAIGTSLAAIVGNAIVSLGFRGVDAVDWAVAVPFTAAMLIGTFAGSRLAHRLPARRSLQGFAVLLVAVAIGNGIAAGVALAG
jgi:uncharacterized membrane protein YfcA